MIIIHSVCVFLLSHTSVHRNCVYNTIDLCALHSTIITETHRQLLKRISNEIEVQGLHTQTAIIVSMHMTLLPESGGSTKAKPRTLEGLYNGLCSSRKYCYHSDRIFYCIVQLLSLNIKDAELQMLKKQADLQSEDILNSKDIKFLKLINFLSYEPKESLIDANILPASSRSSTEDAAKLISVLIQRGHIAPTSASLVNLLKSVKNNEPYKMRIKEVMDAPVWTITKATTAIVTSYGDPVEPDSPQLSENPSLGALSYGGSGWTSKKLASTVQIGMDKIIIFIEILRSL